MSEEMIQVAGVRLSKSVYDEVCRLADENSRTIVGQVAFLVRWAIAAQSQQAAALQSRSELRRKGRA